MHKMEGMMNFRNYSTLTHLEITALFTTFKQWLSSTKFPYGYFEMELTLSQSNQFKYLLAWKSIREWAHRLHRYFPAMIETACERQQRQSSNSTFVKLFEFGLAKHITQIVVELLFSYYG